MGVNKLDAIPQAPIQNENAVYAGAGVYPLEGGYIYIVSTSALDACDESLI